MTIYDMLYVLFNEFSILQLLLWLNCILRLGLSRLELSSVYCVLPPLSAVIGLDRIRYVHAILIQTGLEYFREGIICLSFLHTIHGLRKIFPDYGSK